MSQDAGRQRARQGRSCPHLAPEEMMPLMLTHPLPGGKLPLPWPAPHPASWQRGTTQTPLPVPALGTPTPHSPTVIPPTHIFEGKYDSSDNPGHHDHDAQHAEEPRTRRKINLPVGKLMCHGRAWGVPTTQLPAPDSPPGQGRSHPPPCLGLEAEDGDNDGHDGGDEHGDQDSIGPIRAADGGDVRVTPFFGIPLARGCW